MGLVLVLGLWLSVYEVASFSVHTEALIEKHSTFLGLVFGVDLLVFAQLVGAMCEFALLLVRTKAKFYVFFAKLRFFLILPYRRLVGVGVERVSGGG